MEISFLDVINRVEDRWILVEKQLFALNWTTKRGEIYEYLCHCDVNVNLYLKPEINIGNSNPK
jgi:hypothetical protein